MYRYGVLWLQLKQLSFALTIAENMTTYTQLMTKLGNREKRKLGNNTYLEKRGETKLAIRLHATDVLLFEPDKVTVQTGGWRTLTTKDRINSYAPCTIYQAKGQWYWRTGEQFTEGDYFDSTGKLHTQATPEAEKQEHRPCMVLQCI